MKQTYIKILDNNKKTGRGAVTWRYYDIFSKIFHSDRAVNMTNTISSMKVTKNKNEINPGLLHLPTLDCTIMPSTSAVMPSTSSETCNTSIATDNTDDPKSDNISNISTKKPKTVKQSGKESFEILRLEESKKMRLSLEKIAQAQEQRNKLLEQLLQKP